MTRTNKYCIVTLFYALTFTGQTSAETRNHDIHEHGLSRVNIAMEDNRIDIEFLAPAVNIVGFEHAPSNNEQEQALEEAEKILTRGDGMFSFPPDANCLLIDSAVESELLNGHHEGDEHSHDEHSHDRQGGASDRIHAEFHATYAYKCVQPEAVKFIDMGIFAVFKGTEKLDVQAVGSGGQTAAQLTRETSRIHF